MSFPDLYCRDNLLSWINTPLRGNFCGGPKACWLILWRRKGGDEQQLQLY